MVIAKFNQAKEKGYRDRTRKRINQAHRIGAFKGQKLIG